MQTSHQESGRTTPCQFVPTDGWPEVGLSLFNQDCSHVFFPTQMVLWKGCSATQWLCNAPGTSGDSWYNPNAPHFKAPTWLFVFAFTLKYWPLLPNCSLGLPTVAHKVSLSLLNRGPHAATVKICLLLHTLRLYHGKVIKWAIINYVLSWKKEFKVHRFCFQTHN